ncbi:Fibrinogen-like protein A,Ryncolin-2,Angiopoietin-1,Ryncolin-4,Angiopoietin-2,Microfibril-associated glycoprotein 4,Angiopoietin-related protein 7,Ficolin-1-A,Ficolin-1-B,Ficolin-2,Ryncolin-1,Ryncolin-3,Ficolin-1,Angiopoietin-4 [Mytilus coruscus]|uniref:Fibrinogen C-terminal domain-containing protein n=1 Tax=Mytilus coruscus TaxID=42192 RepID=A0A6J8DT17_MYTCO|nr:Fibrinogen-like protein A,Ryncolin-2,Angiopoietin-1,Ryncolin-4,Angiopoietin-2,Microfibril-associated glycoprotein 4,Angiopoietin-related protein 7,Ficolin-1-A,Ficolin-1-B,Ficolin-2,Ryncolin-1,Ryncolin-3,Ficolin-1,Angiopoietin-4 [Mytilus coruscus]
MVCQGCCNSTNVCNLNTPCDIAVNHNTSVVNLLPRECEDINSTKSGVHTIYPDSYTPVRVFCVITKTEKWTVIQKRFDGFVDFYRSWDGYKQGFGDPAGEYWLGNEALHKISSSTGHQLSIYTEDFDAKSVYANYSNFLIGDELENYQLTVSGFSASPGVGDSLSENNHKSFSTKDKDNDPHNGLNCAQSEHGAWWYSSCGYSSLNGPYKAGSSINEKSAFWYYWKNNFYSLKRVTIMIKRIRKID